MSIFNRMLNVKNLMVTFILWIFAVMVRFLFFHEVNNALWILSLLLDGLLIVLAAVLIIAMCIAVLRHQLKVLGLFTIIFTAVIIYLMWFTSVGFDIGTYFRLWRYESEYSREIQHVLQTNKADWRKLSYPMIIDEGPPIRVAFSWGGIIDNWHGIVYDPTGEVLKANPLKSDSDPNLQRIKTLFGGDMIFAKHLWGYWYYCTFT